jgi:hypothetical protein
VKSSIENRARPATRREQRSFIHEIGQVGAGESRRERCDLGWIDILGERDLAQMNGEDLDAPDAIRPIDQHLPIEAAGAQQRRVEDLGRWWRHSTSPDAGIEAVELHQHLIQRSCSFSVVPLADTLRVRVPAHPARR